MLTSTNKSLFTLSAAVWLLVVGCGSTPGSRFYVLSPIDGDQQAAQAAPAQPGILLHLSTVRLPKYLDRPQIVRRSGDNQLLLAEFDRWAEPLDHDFARVLSENLAGLLAGNGVTVLPWQSSATADYSVRVHIVRFEGQSNTEATLMANWAILPDNKDAPRRFGKSSYVEPLEANSYAALVAAQSKALGHLSRDIATAVQEVLK